MYNRLTSLVGAGVGGSVGLVVGSVVVGSAVVGSAVVGAFVGEGVGLSVTSFHVKTGLAVGDEVITIGVGRNVVGVVVVGTSVVGLGVG